MPLSFYLLCSATSGLTGPVPPPLPSWLFWASQLFLRSPTDPKAKISLLNFLSEFFNFSLELSIPLSKGGAHSSLKLVSLRVFNTFLPGSSSMGTSKHLPFATPSPLTSGKHNQQTPCWMGDYRGHFFSFGKWSNGPDRIKSQKNPTDSSLFPIFNIWGNDLNFQCFNIWNCEAEVRKKYYLLL